MRQAQAVPQLMHRAAEILAVKLRHRLLHARIVVLGMDDLFFRLYQQQRIQQLAVRRVAKPPPCVPRP